MELWIRSQDKEDLIKAYNFRILHQNDIAINVRFNGSTLEYLIIGKYATKERALEVLDEIQNILNPMLIFKNCECDAETFDKIKKAKCCIINDNAKLEQLDTCVYQMPED